MAIKGIVEMRSTAKGILKARFGEKSFSIKMTDGNPVLTMPRHTPETASSELSIVRNN
jgi:hypothetical protein